MRILIVDVNFEYKNPMYRQFYSAISGCMETDFFGPGYVSRGCLEKGINAYLFENAKYDAILLGTYFAYSSGEYGTRYDAYHVHRHTIPYYNINDAYQCCTKIFGELLTVHDIIKIFMYYEDIWSMPSGDKDMCQKLMKHGFYLLSWPIEYMEKYSMEQMREHCQWTNCAYELAQNDKMHYIPISMHGIGYHEIFVRDFSNREYEWCIPGNRIESYYPERKKAYEIVQKEQKKVWNDDPYQTLSVETIRREHIKWYKFRNRTEKFLSWIWGKDDHIASHPKMRYIAACREQYLESMRSSKFVYAESGIVRGFVRKYFEACACGAVLVAKKVPGMNEMGFIHEENCIVVDKYEDITSIDNSYSEEQLRKIAQSGQRLILDKHMFCHRAEALEKTLKAILQDIYKGAFWKNGDYILK